MTTIAAVGYLNALPLISGLELIPGINLVTKVPAALFNGLERGTFDVALCPVIDAQRSRIPLEIIGSGAIGSSGQTLTVRVFSRVPINEIRRIQIDQESHTSVALLQVIFSRRYGRVPVLDSLTDIAALGSGEDLEAALLIGDKVVTDEPPRSRFPFQLDLGLAWKELTGLPFVFATWLTRAGADLGELPLILEDLRNRNLEALEGSTPEWAEAHGWPTDLALTYLRDLLSYRFAAQEQEAVRRFWNECAALGLTATPKEIPLYGSGG